LRALAKHDLKIKVLDPNSYRDIYNDRGISLFRLGRYQDAASSFEALAVDPNNEIILNGMGLAMFQTGRFEDAIRYFNKILEINTRDPKIWYNKGTALFQLKRYHEAEKCFKQSLAIDPDYKLAALLSIGKKIGLCREVILGRYEVIAS
jgi:tetratricopeptide (TPR) repeat protein